MVKVVIVSRTRMGAGVCIGGLTREDSRNVRLLPRDGAHAHPADAPYRIGEVWELDLAEPSAVEPPHVEDMIVRRGRRLAVKTGLDFWLRDHVEPWEGDASALFDGVLQVTDAGTAYVGRAAVPACSVGFWLPETPLVLDEQLAWGENRLRYRTSFEGMGIDVAYVGCEPAAPEIPAWSLVRVSLARWFAPGDVGFERCWLQVSGWYPSSAASVSGPMRSGSQQVTLATQLDRG